MDLGLVLTQVTVLRRLIDRDASSVGRWRRWFRSLADDMSGRPEICCHSLR